jgi:predicted DNA-binding transcriptional regulator AlpA
VEIRKKTPSAALQRRFVNDRELEAVTGISSRTWQKHRLFGRGPRYYRICGAVRYDLEEVIEWIKANGDGAVRRAEL